MSFFVVDVEADGPIPADYSMVCFGAVLCDSAFTTTFYGRVRPISDRYVPEALAVSGFSRAEHETFDDPAAVMARFAAWLAQHSKSRPIFASDNLAFDWQWINFYFHRYTGKNPFGFSGRRIGDIYAGLMRDVGKASEWKKYRVTRHSHNPVDDAIGNAEAFRKFAEFGLRF